MKKILFTCLFAAICGTTGAQDLIVLRNAEDIDAKVLRVSKTDVEYRKAGNPEGPVYSLPVGEILFIRYENGSKDVFAEEQTHELKQLRGHGPAQQPKTEVYKRNPKLATGPGPVENGGGRHTYGQMRTPRFKHHTEKYPYYQGEISAAYGLGVGAGAEVLNTDRIVFETIHGVRVCPYFFGGIGAGFTYFYQDLLDKDYFNSSVEFSGAGMLPVFANLKGYYPFNAKVAVFMSLDLGVAIPISGYMKGAASQFYTSVGPSVEFGNGLNHLRPNLGVRFQYMGSGTNAVVFRFGFSF